VTANGFFELSFLDNLPRRRLKKFAGLLFRDLTKVRLFVLNNWKASCPAERQWTFLTGEGYVVVCGTILVLELGRESRGVPLEPHLQHKRGPLFECHARAASELTVLRALCQGPAIPYRM